MSLVSEKYLPRLVDEKIKNSLKVFGALSIEGPKWCGKTWTSLSHANSVYYLDEENTRRRAELSLDLILDGKAPELIDEWNLVPQVWDAVRRKCDETPEKGNYILTCSTKLTDAEQKARIHHSGAGRIGKIKMRPMSLFESGDSAGLVSLRDLRRGRISPQSFPETPLEQLAYLIIRGGWPSNLSVAKKNASLVPKSYLEAILDKDMNDDKKRNREKMAMLLKSLARNEATVSNNSTLLKDINDREAIKIESRTTLDDYLGVLNRLHLIDNQSAYGENYRSPERLGKNPKRHLTDPSLAAAALDLSAEKLLKDLNTFGFLFESLVERDLEIYMDALDGKLFHFRDNVSGLEVDSILEFSNGDYAAVEIKLGLNQFEEARKNLQTFAENMKTPPKFMCVIVGFGDVIAKDPESGIFIVPITALKP